MQRLKSTAQDEARNQTISKKRLARTFIILMISIIALATWNLLMTKSIEENGLEINATLIDVNHQRFVLNQQDGTSVNTYFFQYQFDYLGKSYIGIHEIPSQLTSKYFEAIPSKGTDVTIQFLPTDPDKNQIKKADKAL